MGKLYTQGEAIIHHFSHPHPLNLTNHLPQQTLSLASCSSCLLSVSGCVYTCKPCNYFLHIDCSQLPTRITHPFHQTHILSLLPTPIYPGGLFNCDACGKPGNGFSYHCGPCTIDLHPGCATKPLVLTQQPHHHHHLNLTFYIPYPNKIFSCDVCGDFGVNQWIYRCSFCEFDAHLKCAMAEPKRPRQDPPPAGGYDYTNVGAGMVCAGPDVEKFQPNYNANFVSNGNINTGTGSVARSGGQGNNLLNQVVQSFVTGAAETMGQSLVQGLLGGGGGGSGGGGGGGGDLLSSFNGGGIDLGGFGGGGGGIDFGGPENN